MSVDQLSSLIDIMHLYLSDLTSRPPAAVVDSSSPIVKIDSDIYESPVHSDIHYSDIND